jgi:hypothetical protein
MNKISQETIDQIRDHARLNPQHTYAQIAASFGVSIISVKRYCADLGRSKRWRKGRTSGDSSDQDRLWSQVERKPGQCWEWRGCTNAAGYGFMHWQGKSWPVHKLAYEFIKGTIPEHLELDHRCRNRVCCNPDHLEP